MGMGMGAGFGMMLPGMIQQSMLAQQQRAAAEHLHLLLLPPVVATVAEMLRSVLNFRPTRPCRKRPSSPSCAR